GTPNPLPGLDQEPNELHPFADVHPVQRDLLLRASVDNDRPFVGQQVTYSLYLLARINVSGIDKLQLPRLDGFWTEEIEAPQQLVGEARILDGVPYRSFLLRKRPLVATGRGNVRDLRLPRLGAIPGLRAYDATTTDKEAIEKGQVTGTRTVEQLLVPERTGVVEVPSLAMDIFDPVQKQYRTLHTDA